MKFSSCVTVVSDKTLRALDAMLRTSICTFSESTHEWLTWCEECRRRRAASRENAVGLLLYITGSSKDVMTAVLEPQDAMVGCRIHEAGALGPESTAGHYFKWGSRLLFEIEDRERTFHSGGSGIGEPLNRPYSGWIYTENERKRQLRGYGPRDSSRKRGRALNDARGALAG